MDIQQKYSAYQFHMQSEREQTLGCIRTKLRFSYGRLHWAFLYICMRFEVTTMLPVHTPAVKI